MPVTSQPPMSDTVSAVSQLYRVEWQRRHGNGFRRAEEVLIMEAADAGELQVKMRALPGRVLTAALARLHTCCICGRASPWSDEWSWFGRWQDIDDDLPVKKFCSAPCRAAGPKGDLINGE